MSCSNCGHVWKVPGVRPDSPVFCPMCEQHVCGCGCGADLGDMRADALFQSRACYIALIRAGEGTPRAASANVARTQPLEEIRAAQEVGRRASSNPRRHKRKSGVFELTRKGREGPPPGGRAHTRRGERGGDTIHPP